MTRGKTKNVTKTGLGEEKETRAIKEIPKTENDTNKQTRKILDAIIVRLILIYLSELKSLFIIPLEDYIQNL